VGLSAISVMPLLPPMRRRRASRTSRRCGLSHNQRRIGCHHFGWTDPRRMWLANIAIGSPWWIGLFGDPRAAWALSYFVSNLITFPERPRSEIARLRAEIEELRKTVRGGRC
jgi:hypothetical protein